MLYLLVNIGFQVLFTPLPGFFSPFLHSTASLSVISLYLGLGGGPPGFPANSSCSLVLWILTPDLIFRVRDYHPLWFGFPTNSARSYQWIIQSATPVVLLPPVWPLSLSLAATKKIDVSFSSSAYIDVSVQRVSPQYAMYSHIDDWVLLSRVSTFGNLRVIRIFAPNRSLSQLITSFVGNWCQGIRPTLFIAWPVLDLYSKSNYMRLSLFPLKLLLLPLTFKKDLLLILLIAFALDISYISLQKYSVVNVHW